MIFIDKVFCFCPQTLLFTHIRLAHCFSNHEKRLQCVQTRLQAMSVLGKFIGLDILKIGCIMASFIYMLVVSQTSMSDVGGKVN